MDHFTGGGKRVVKVGDQGIYTETVHPGNVNHYSCKVSWTCLPKHKQKNNNINRHSNADSASTLDKELQVIKENQQQRKRVFPRKEHIIG